MLVFSFLKFLLLMLKEVYLMCPYVANFIWIVNLSLSVMSFFADTKHGLFWCTLFSLIQNEYEVLMYSPSMNHYCLVSCLFTFLVVFSLNPISFLFPLGFPSVWSWMLRWCFCSETGDTDTEEETRHCLCIILWCCLTLLLPATTSKWLQFNLIQQQWGIDFMCMRTLFMIGKATGISRSGADAFIRIAILFHLHRDFHPSVRFLIWSSGKPPTWE